MIFTKKKSSRARYAKLAAQQSTTDERRS